MGSLRGLRLHPYSRSKSTHINVWHEARPARIILFTVQTGVNDGCAFTQPAAHFTIEIVNLAPFQGPGHLLLKLDCRARLLGHPPG